MTKIIFVSDIHLNLRKDFEFEKNRFNLLIEELCLENKDILILGGDIFDYPNPNLDEISLFYSAINKLNNFYKEIIVIGGNHENLNKKECTFDKLPKLNFTFIDKTINLEDSYKIEGFHLYFVSHYKINEIKNIELSDKQNILFSHIRSNLGMIKEEIKIKPISNNFDFVFLGDIHKKHSPFYNVNYCGSPYNKNYDITKDTGYFEISLEKGSIDYQFITLTHLPQKLKLTVDIENYNKVIDTLDKNNLYKIYLSGLSKDMSELKKPVNVDLIVDILLDTEGIEKLVDDIKDNSFIDIYSKFYSIVLQSEELNDNSLIYGKELLENIKKGLI